MSVINIHLKFLGGPIILCCVILCSVFFKPGAGKNITLCASITARESAYLFSAVSVTSTSFSPFLFNYKVICNVNTESDFGL